MPKNRKTTIRRSHDRKKPKGGRTRIPKHSMKYNSVQEVQASRTDRAKSIDNLKNARTIAQFDDPDAIIKWMKSPNRMDLEGIDTIGGETFTLEDVRDVIFDLHYSDSEIEPKELQLKINELQIERDLIKAIIGRDVREFPKDHHKRVIEYNEIVHRLRSYVIVNMPVPKD